MVRDIRVADEVWIGCALLHNENPRQASFSNLEIANRVRKEGIADSFRIGVQWHINLHCAANKPANPDRHRMLYELPDGSKRLFKTDDNYHHTREGGKTLPEASDIPQQYRYLLKWYNEFFNRGKTSPPPPPTSTPSILSPKQDTKTSPNPPVNNPKVIAHKFMNEQELTDFSYRCPKVAGSFSKNDNVCKNCSNFIEEDQVKIAVTSMLKMSGWTINNVAMGRSHGVDIEATNNQNQKLLVEAKGEGTLNPMRVNNFLNVLGELLQKMDSPDKQYGIALPAHQQYVSLIRNLPNLQKQQLKLRIFIVKRTNNNEYAVGYLTYQ